MKSDYEAVRALIKQIDARPETLLATQLDLLAIDQIVERMANAAPPPVAPAGTDDIARLLARVRAQRDRERARMQSHAATEPAEIARYAAAAVAIREMDYLDDAREDVARLTVGAVLPGGGEGNDAT